MDSPDKVSALLASAGFPNPSIEVAAWSDHPTLAEFVARHATLGAAGRRLATLGEEEQSAFLVEVQLRLESLTLDNFLDAGDVILATTSAP
jgi:hypothetical protein